MYRCPAPMLTQGNRIDGCQTACLVLTLFICFSLISATQLLATENNLREQVTLHLRWQHQFQFAGYYAAIEKGFYADEGLDVELMTIKQGTDMISPVVDGTADYGVADGSLLAARSKGIPVVLLAQIFQHSPQVFLSLRKTGINSPFDLKGKKVMFDARDAAFSILLIETLGDNNDFKIIPQSYNLDDLINSEVDMVAAYLTNEPYQLQKMGLEYNILHPQGYGLDYFGDNLFTSEAEIREHPDRVQKMIRATLKGWKYALNNTNEIIDLILEKYNPSADRDKLIYEARVTREMILPDTVPLGTIDRSRYQKIAKGYAQLRVIDNPRIPDGFIYGQPKPPQIELSDVEKKWLLPTDAEKNNRITLTQTEETWLKAHPDITLTFSANYEPYLITHPNGSHSGVLATILDRLNQRLGTNIQIATGTHSENIKTLIDGTVAGTFALRPEHADKLGVLKTKSYITGYPVLFTTRGTTVSSPKDLAGKTIVHLASEYYSQEIIDQYGKGATIINTDSSLNGLQLVDRGEADVFIGISSSAYLITKYQFTNLVPRYTFTDFPMDFAMGINKNLPELVPILNKGLVSFSEQEIRAITEQWIQPANNQPLIKLTNDEWAWLTTHPHIQFGFPDIFEPYLVKGQDDQHTGILVDILEMINRRLGTHFEVKIEAWSKIFNKVKNRELDGVLGVINTTADNQGLLKTEPLFSVSYSFFMREDAPFTFRDLGDLPNRSVATYGIATDIDKLLEPYLSEITLVKFPTSLEAIQAVFEGKVDLLLGLSSLNYTISKHGLYGIKPAHTLLNSPFEIVMGVHSDYPELQTILNKVLSSLSPYELEAIQSKWINTPVQKRHEINLSPVEKAWLAQKHTVRVRTLDIPPYIIKKQDDIPEGIAIDYLQLIAQRTGLQLDYSPTGLTFHEAIEGIKNHQGPDLIPTIIQTPERKDSILFTGNYISSPIMIFMRSNDKQLITSIEDLAGQQVSILKGSAQHKMTARDYPALGLLPFGSDIEAMEAVAGGEAAAYIGILNMTAYHILHRGLYNLKLAAPTPFGEYAISMGARNDWPELTSIINKGLANITEDEHNKIRNKYISVHYNTSNSVQYTKWISIIGITTLGILGLVILWNKGLRNQVLTRTAELKESERKYRRVLESTSIVPWERDIGTGEYTFMGKQVALILGYPDNSWKTVNDWIERIHPEDKIGTAEYFEQQSNKEMDYDYIYRILHMDGSYRWIRDVVSVLKGESGPEKLVGFMHDVTEQKELAIEKEHLQKHWEHTQKLEAVGTLAGGIAHDFNNILSAILGFTELAKDSAEEHPEIVNDLDEVLHAGHRAKELVQQILSFSRQSQIERVVLEPQLIVKEALKMLRPTLPATIEIKENIASNHLKIMAVPAQMHQIIVNLTTNAFHAMEAQGGTMVVTLQHADTVPLGLNHNSTGYIQLSVSDTGVGIAPDMKDLVFDPFFTTKEQGKGTGMGLSIIYGIVKDYGGIITVDSESGKGATFNVYIPQIEEAAQLTDYSDGDIPGGTERILFIDDEHAIAKAGKGMLEKLGYTVTSKTECLEALQTFQAEPDAFDLIITDQTMPGMTGFDLSKKVLQIRPNIPIILCTGYSSIVSEDVAKSQGIREFTNKPITKNVISRLIRKTLDAP